MTKTALFHNFTDKPFTGYWDGKAKTFAPNAKKYMPLYLAEHYAKHLANKVLIEKEEYTSTSPKKPHDVPLFQELFDKACIPEDGDDLDETEIEVDMANRRPMASDMENSPKSIEKEILADEEEEFEGLKEDSDEEEE